MKKLIIDCKNFILKVDASEDNTTIFDSYKVKKSFDMKSIIYYIRDNTPKEYAINVRSIPGMVREWRVHNLLYSLGLFKDRTRDVDLNTGQPRYAKVLYFILSPFYLHF